MFSLSKLLWLLVIGSLVYLWLANARFRERALQAAKVQCKLHDIQHLDQNVVLKRMWPRRNNAGRWAWRRIFQFEFTSTGERRYRGVVVFDGPALIAVELEAHRVPYLH